MGAGNLQKRLLARMRSFGMTPVLSAFAGHVPKAFIELHRNTSYTRRRVIKIKYMNIYIYIYILRPHFLLLCGGFSYKKRIILEKLFKLIKLCARMGAARTGAASTPSSTGRCTCWSQPILSFKRLARGLSTRRRRRGARTTCTTVIRTTRWSHRTGCRPFLPHFLLISLLCGGF